MEIKALFYSDGMERCITKHLLNTIDCVPVMHRLAATCLFPKTENLRIFFTPRYAQKRYSAFEPPVSISESLPHAHAAEPLTAKSRQRQTQKNIFRPQI